MRLIHELDADDVDLHHYIDCPEEQACLEWIVTQRRPRWRAYTCRYCWRWTKKPE